MGVENTVKAAGGLRGHTICIEEDVLIAATIPRSTSNCGAGSQTGGSGRMNGLARLSEFVMKEVMHQALYCVSLLWTPDC